jgi:carbon monoxide dehydrogenase subunit G
MPAMTPQSKPYSSFLSSFFWPVKTAASSKFINAPVDAVLKVLHDPTAVIKLDPLVHTCTQSTSQTGLWNVVDRINILKWHISLPYTATFRSQPDGVTIDVKASKLVAMRNTWQVKGTKEGTEVFMSVQSKVCFLVVSAALMRHYSNRPRIDFHALVALPAWFQPKLTRFFPCTP